MRKLFNNRWFIVALGVGSLLLVVRSVAVPLLSEPERAEVEPIVEDYLVTAAGEEPLAAPAPRPQAAGVAGTPGASVLGGRLLWNDAPRRDPFSSRHPEGGGEPLSDGQTKVPAPDAALPKLSALVAGRSSLLAVLDDQVVETGDSVRSFEVTRIGHDGVEVRSGRHRVWIPVPED